MVIFVIGLPGTGKTFFAKALAEKLHAVHISSDHTRSEMKMMGKYDVNSRLQVYDEMKKKVERTLLSGKNVVVDATFYSAEIRTAFFKLAESFRTDQYIVLMTAIDETIYKRTSLKRPDSEADYNTYLKLKELFEPLHEKHLIIQSDHLQLNEMLEKTLNYITLKG